MERFELLDFALFKVLVCTIKNSAVLGVWAGAIVYLSLLNSILRRHNNDGQI